MNTSTIIKARQYQPIVGVRNGNVWTFTSESNPHTTYTTRRVSGTHYVCNCPATGLCKHITSAMMDDARAKWNLVQVWTSEQDANRQHRQTIQMSANQGRTFWVTFAGKREEEPMEQTKSPTPTTAPRSAVVEFLWDRMTPPDEMDLWLIRRVDTTVNGRPAREDLDTILNMEGWSHSSPVMVQGNAQPGYHRFRVELREIV